MNFIKTDTADTINNFRSKLYQIQRSPIDAMWEQLYIASSQHFLIKNDSNTIGYCCIDDEACLIQLFLEKEYCSNMDNVIDALIKSELINSASLSSNEPIAFNACLLLSKSTKANTFCFEHINETMELNSILNVELVSTEDIPAIKVFLKEQVGMDDTFGYTENLVSRKELFMLKELDEIIATSECRMSNSQPDVADLGIIVKQDNRGKGIATHVMQMQVNRVINANRKPICSTTAENVASRKVIEKSGFYCSSIIFDISFS